jgi:lipopolysaccharide export system permease protein
MIFQRAVRREFTHSAAGVFTALFAIMMTTQLIRLLNEAVQGRIETDAVAALARLCRPQLSAAPAGTGAVHCHPVDLSRAYRDSEMVVWFSSGLPLTAWIRPVMTFAAPLVATIAVLAFVLSPWALSESSDFRGKLSTRKDAGQVSPGVFQESSTGDRVIFVEGSPMTRVTCATSSSAKRGQTAWESRWPAGVIRKSPQNGDRFIVLKMAVVMSLRPVAPSSESSSMHAMRFAWKPRNRGHRANAAQHAHPGAVGDDAPRIGPNCCTVSACRFRLSCWPCCRFRFPSSTRVRVVQRTCCWRFWPT